MFLCFRAPLGHQQPFITAMAEAREETSSTSITSLLLPATTSKRRQTRLHSYTTNLSNSSSSYHRHHQSASLFWAVVCCCLAVLALAPPIGCDAATISIASGSLTTTEDSIRAGGHVVSINLVGSTWNALSTSVMNDLIAGFSTNSADYFPYSSFHYTASWRQRKNIILTSSSFSLVSSSVLKVTLQSDSSYNIALREVVNITIPSTAVASGAVPNRLFLAINPSSGTVTMPAYQFTEASIRSGGMLLTIALSSQETWSDARTIVNYTRGASSASTLWNAIVFKGEAMRPGSLAVSGQNVVVSLIAAPSYDCNSDEVVTIDVPSSAVRSGLKPSGTITFTIKVSNGFFYFPNPTVLKETWLITGRSSAVAITLTLDSGETWKTSLSTSSVISQLTSNRADTYGFNNRRSTLLSTGSVSRLDDRHVKIQFNVDPTYDTNGDETVTFTGLGAMVNSGIAPLRKTGSAYSDSFTISVTPGLVKWEGRHMFAESDILSGSKSITFTLERGETWAAGKEADILAGFVATTSQTNGWNNRKATMLPLSTSPKAITLGGSNRDLVLSFAVGTSSLYDITSTELVRFTATAGMMSSSTAPYNTTLEFWITASAGTLSMTHATKTSPFSFTEDEVRRGMGTITLTWSQGETWSGHSFMALNISSDSPQSSSWRSRVMARGYLLASSRITYINGMRTMLLDVQGDVEYDIYTTETLYVRVDTAAISSRLLPSPLVPPDKFFQITVTPTAGKVTMLCCPQYTEGEMQRGGAKLVLRLDHGESWVSGYESSVRSSLSSNRLDETNGWNQRVAWLVSTSATTGIVISNTSRVLTITFKPDPHYNLVRYTTELITINLNIATGFPAGAFRSGKQVSPESLTFNIVQQASLVNGTTTLTEKSLHVGGAALRYFTSTWESWASGQGTAMSSAFSSAQSEATGFNALRSTILPSYAWTISSSGMVLTGKTVASSTYNIVLPETVTVSFPSSVFSGATTPKATTLTITVSPGEFTPVTPVMVDDSTLRTSGTRVTITMAGWEDWSTTVSNSYTNIISATTSDSPATEVTSFLALRSSFLTTSSFSVSGKAMVITFAAVPTYYPKYHETITVTFPATATKSGLAMSSAKLLFIRRTASKITSVPTSITITDYQIRTQDNSFTLTIHGDTWTVNEACRMYVNTTKNSTTTLPDYLHGYNTHRSMMVLTRHATDPRQMIVTLRKSTTFDLNKQETVTVTPSRFCYGTHTLPNPVSFTVALTVNPGTLSTSPTTFTELDIRRGTAMLTLTIGDNGEGWSRHAYWIVKGLSSSRTAAQEPTGYESRKGVLFPFDNSQRRAVCEPEPAATSMCTFHTNNKIVLRLYDTLYDTTTTETITVNPNFFGGNHAPCFNGTATPTPSPNPLTFTITPIQASVSLHLRGAHINEHDIRARHVRFNLTLSDGETWVDTLSARSEIIKGMSSNLLLGFGGSSHAFNALKTQSPTALLIADKVHMKLIENWTYNIIMNMTPTYETTADETITITIPAMATSSGIAPSNTLSFVIKNEVGVWVSVAPAAITEAQIRAGTTFKLYISRKEDYSPNNASWTGEVTQLFPAAMASNRIGSGYEYAFNQRKNLMFPTGSTTYKPQAVTLTTTADPMFDTPTSETVTLTIPSYVTNLKTAPMNQITLTILPSSGVVALSPTSYSVSEDSVRLGLASFNVSLATGETWKSSGLVDMLTALSSAQSEATGFNVLRSSLITSNSFKIKSRWLEITLQAVPTYDITADETVTITFPTTVFTSGLVSSPTSLSFVVKVARHHITMAPYPFSLTEAQVRTGGATLTLTLSDGEKWKSITSLTSGFVATTTATNGFNNRKANILPTFAYNMVTDYVVVATFKVDAVYDISSQETVRITIPSATIASGLVPYSLQYFEFNVSATPSTVSLKATGTYVTEKDLRRGSGSLTFIISEDTWAADAANMLGGMVSAQSESSGFNVRKNALLNVGSFVIQNSNTELKVTFMADSGYDITADETVSFNIPYSSTTGRHAPSNSPVTFKILRTYLTMNTTSFTEEQIKLGAARVEIRVVHDSWVTGTQASGISAMSPTVADSMGTGFAKYRDAMFTTSTAYFTGNSLVYPIQPTGTYDMCAKTQTVSFTLPDTMFDSGKAPKQTMSFTITGSPGSVTLSRVDASYDARARATTYIEVSEEFIRYGRLQLNVTADVGGWNIGGSTFNSRINGSHAVSSAPYGFESRKSVILSNTGGTVLSGHTMTVMFRPDAWYDITSNETVSIDLLSSHFQCDIANTRLQFFITGKPASVTSMHVYAGAGRVALREQTFIVGEIVSLLFRGYELMPAFDAVRIVRNTSDCTNASKIYSSGEGRAGLKTSSSLPHVTWVNWTTAIHTAGSFTVCYRLHGVSRYVPMYPQLTFKPQLRGMRIVSPVRMSQFVSGALVNVTFWGIGLNTQEGGDSAKLVAPSEGENCETGKGIIHVPDLPGNAESDSTVTLSANMTSPGSYLWCYRFKGTNRWMSYVAYNISTTFSSVYSPSVFEPLSPIKISITGRGIDTRVAARKTRTSVALVLATAYQSGNCTATGSFLSLHNDFRMNTSNATDISFTAWAGLRPGWYTVCVKGYRVGWASLGRPFRVMSIVQSYGPVQARQGGVPQQFNITGLGLLVARPPVGIPTLKIIRSNQDCTSATSADGAKIFTNMPSSRVNSAPQLVDVVTAVHTFPVEGEHALCWATPERSPRWYRLVPNIVVKSTVVSYAPTTVSASRSFGVTVDGLAMNPKKMSVFVVSQGETCATKRAPLRRLRIIEATEPQSKIHTESTVFEVPGTYRVCVNTTWDIVSLPVPLTIRQEVLPLPSTHILEQHDTSLGNVTITGMGLSTSDVVQLVNVSLSSGCDVANPSSAVFATSSAVALEPRGQSTGLHRVTFSFDTTKFGQFYLCYRPARWANFVGIGNVTIYKYRRHLYQFWWVPNAAGTSVTLSVRGRGLDTRTNSDSIKVVVHNVNPVRTPRPDTTPNPTPSTATPTPATTAPPQPVCSDSTLTTLYQTTNLGTNDAELQYLASTVWTDPALPHYPAQNVTVCYRYAGDATYFRIGDISLPFANQRPEFDLFTKYMEVREVTESTAFTKTLDTYISQGYPRTEWWQRVMATSRVNDTSIVTAAQFDPKTSHLTYNVAPYRYGFVRFDLTLSDDGGRAYMGNNTIVQSLVLRVFPRNTAPTFTITNASLTALQSNDTLHHVRGFITNILGGTVLDHETNQNVTFTVQLTSASQHKAYFSLLPEVYFSTSSGRRVAHLRYRLNPQTALPTTVSFTVTAHDNGGRANSGVDVSAPQPFKISILFVNRAPSYRWAQPPQNVTSYAEVAHTIPDWISGIDPGLNEAWQSVRFIVQTLRNGVPVNASYYFTHVPTVRISGTTASLSFQGRRNFDGNFTFRVHAVDNGGTQHYGQDTSWATASFNAYLYAHYGLAVSPPKGGVSLATTFRISVTGGTAFFTQGRGVHNELYMMTDGSTTFAQSRAILMRSRSTNMTYVSTSIPSGTISVFAFLTDSADVQVDVAVMTFVVAPHSANVSLAGIVNEAASLATTDPNSAIFIAGSAGLMLQDDPSNATAVRDELTAVVGTAVATLLSTRNTSITSAELTSSVNALRELTTRSSAETTADTRLTDATLNATMTTQGLLLTTAKKNVSSVSTDVLTRMQEVTSNLVAGIPKSTAKVSPPGTTESADAVFERQRIGAISSRVSNVAHNVVQLECARKLADARASKADATITPATVGAIIQSGVVVNTAARSTTNTVSQSINVGNGKTVAFSLSRPSTDSYVSVVTYPTTNIFPIRNDPASTPTAPIVSIAVEDVATSTGTSAALTLDFPVPAAGSTADTYYLAYFDAKANLWVQGPEMNIVSSSLLRATITSSFAATTSALRRRLMQSSTATTSGTSSVAYGVVHKPKISLDPDFPLVIVPVAAGVFVIFMLLAVALDVVVKPKEDATHMGPGGTTVLTPEQCQYLREYEAAERVGFTFFRNHLWLSWMLSRLPYSTMTRPKRVMCWFTIVHCTLVFLPLLLDTKEVQWEYEKESGVELGKCLWVGAVAGLASSVVAWIIFVLFNSADPAAHYLSQKVPPTQFTDIEMRSPGSPAVSKPLRPAPNGTVRTVLGVVLFVCCSGGSLAGTWILTRDYNYAYQYEEYLMAMLWSYILSLGVYEALHAIVGITTSPPVPTMSINQRQASKDPPASPSMRYQPPPVPLTHGDPRLSPKHAPDLAAIQNPFPLYYSPPSHAMQYGGKNGSGGGGGGLYNSAYGSPRATPPQYSQQQQQPSPRGVDAFRRGGSQQSNNNNNNLHSVGGGAVYSQYGGSNTNNGSPYYSNQQQQLGGGGETGLQGIMNMSAGSPSTYKW
eukprot:PhM_4_TR10499/c0_g1_i2/m.88709